MENYQVNEILHGFQIERKREIPEQKGILYELTHIKTKAKLVYLSTDDKNKHFSVTFKTLPENDTGVFHILEHSVLCGSDKYPVKEPFVELLKSSMNTFLNAMTFPDKTMYPVSSKNEQDFLNLTDVYLDAVFKPAIYHNKKIFEQEGWHYELRDQGDEVVYKGVVFNEMKGATSSIDTMIDNELMRALYPDNAYQYISGGDPKAIPTLTYEEFLHNHQKYYHPSNSYFYIEGDLHIEAVLKKIAHYLDAYEEGESFDLPDQAVVPNTTVRSYYPVAKGEETKEKTQITFGKVVASFDEIQKILAINILSDYLTGSNDAPLKKAILEAHLAQDFYTAITDGIKQPFFVVSAVNTEEKRLLEIKKVIRQVIDEILEKGINKTQLEASLNQLEFTTRDVSEPKGLMHNLLVLSSQLYGGDPALYLSYEAPLKALREALSTHYYEDLLQSLFEDNGVATVVMVPDDRLSERMAEEEKEKLAVIKSSWDQETLKQVIAENEALDAWHETSDTPEALATIPKLSLSDLKDQPEELKTNVQTIDGVTVLTHPSPIDGIVYFNAYFKLDVASHEDLSAYSYLPNLLGSLPTKRSLMELLYDMKANTGRLTFDIGSTSIPGDLDHVEVYLMAKASVLKSKVGDAVRLIKEVLTETDLTNKDYIQPLLLQIYDDFRNDIIGNGHRYAMRKAMSSYSKEAFFNEVVDGLDAYDYLADLVKNFDEKSDGFIAKLVDLQKHQLTRNRLILSMTTSQVDEALINTLIKPFIADYPDSMNYSGATYKIEKPVNLGVVIPNGVSYAALANNLYRLGHNYHGIWIVISTLLSYNYLWNEVRVKGGAYGTGFSSGALGTLAYYSYRDPDVASAIQTYEHSGDFIRAFMESDEDLDQYIISSVAKLEPLRTPRTYGDVADGNYLRHITYDYECARRDEMMKMKKEDLASFAEILDQLGKDHTLCIIGHKEELDRCAEQLDDIRTL